MLPLVFFFFFSLKIRFCGLFHVCIQRVAFSSHYLLYRHLFLLTETRVLSLCLEVCVSRGHSRAGTPASLLVSSAISRAGRGERAASNYSWGSARTSTPQQHQPSAHTMRTGRNYIGKGLVPRASLMGKLKTLGISPRVCAKSIKCPQRRS